MRTKRGPRERAAKAALALLAGASSAGLFLAVLGPPATAATRPRARVAPTVKVATVAKLGKILVNSKGFALYYDANNKPPRHWACTGPCRTVWPPLLLPKGEKKPLAPAGVTGLGVIKSNFGEQVTYDGKPLYTFVRDSRGTVRGNGYHDPWGVWWVARLPQAKASSGGGSW
jgi:predicted lipoprotein with Yx(FWY)xxD motif